MTTTAIIIILILSAALWFGRDTLSHLLHSLLEDLHDTLTNQSFLRKENVHKHYRWSLLISFVGFVLCKTIGIAQLQYAPTIPTLILGGLFLLVLNALREGILTVRGGKDGRGHWNIPFSWLDVRFGMYGGIHGALIASIILKLIS